MKRADRLVWMDLEMTGLDPAGERILEIATLVTDQSLEVVAEGPDLVIRQSDELLDAMDEWNQTHHGASGLIDRVKQSEISEEEAQNQVLSFLEEWCEEREAPLCGNSVHQDRRFLRRYLPRVDAYLHYRIVDVSTLKELVRRWYPDVYEKAPKKQETHRALDDIHESLAELRYYRSEVFR